MEMVNGNAKSFLCVREKKSLETLKPKEINSSCGDTVWSLSPYLVKS